MAVNTFQADVKTQSGGRVKVTLNTDNTSHARELFDAQYGRGNAINLRQISNPRNDKRR